MLVYVNYFAEKVKYFFEEFLIKSRKNFQAKFVGVFPKKAKSALRYRVKCRHIKTGGKTMDLAAHLEEGILYIVMNGEIDEHSAADARRPSG